MPIATSDAGRADGAGRGVAAIAGRRIDAPDTKDSRFPGRVAPRVSADVARHLVDRGIGVVVASAACGADILALEVALELAIRIRIVLPFERGRFRETSVVDRGVAWGERYDRALDAAAQRGDLITLESGSGDDNAAYSRATARIIEEAAMLARDSGEKAVCIAVWDGKPRATGDATQEFVERAKQAGME